MQAGQGLPGRQRTCGGLATYESRAAMSPLECELAGFWQRILGIESVQPTDSFLDLGGTPAHGARLIEELEARFQVVLHLPWLLAAPTLREQAAWLQYRCLDRKMFPEQPPDMEKWRQYFARRFEAEDPPCLKAKNPRAVFVLSPPRSGSTLLRVMLAGHPGLFSPPELELLSCAGMAERYARMGQGWLDFRGLERALSELTGATAEQAAAEIEDWVRQDRAVPDVYAELQKWCGHRLLVDKSPAYCLNPTALLRAEAWFEAPLYVHMVRHPLASIRSWTHSNFDQLIWNAPRATGEAIWLIGHENVLAFLSQVPAERQFRLRYCDLVAEPEHWMRALCRFLGVDFHAATLQPYEGSRMSERVGGLVAGDKNFLRRNSIDAGAAALARRQPEDGPLSEEARRMAERLGYDDL